MAKIWHNIFFHSIRNAATVDGATWSPMRANLFPILQNNGPDLIAPNILAERWRRGEKQIIVNWLLEAFNIIESAAGQAPRPHA